MGLEFKGPKVDLSPLRTWPFWLEFAAIKLFYNEDTNLFTEKDVMALRPEPAVVIYQ